MSFLDHTATWATPLPPMSESLQRRSARPYAGLNRSYAEAGGEDESSLLDDSHKKPDSLSSLRDFFSQQLKSSNDESRSCFKLLSEQLSAFDVRLRTQEKEGYKLEIYKTQTELESRIMKQGQELKGIIGEYAKMEHLKSLEDSLKRSNSLRLQTLEYRLKELSDSYTELHTLMQQLITKERPSVSMPKTDDLISQVFSVTVQRVEKLLERELIPVLNDQEARVSAMVDSKMKQERGEKRAASRGDTELQHRMSAMEESFRGLLQETSLLRSQAKSYEIRSIGDPQLREDLRTMERSFSQSLSQLKADLHSLSKPDFSLKSDLARDLKTELLREIQREVTSQMGNVQREDTYGNLKEEMENLIGKVDDDVKGLIGKVDGDVRTWTGRMDGEIRTLAGRVREVEGRFGSIEGLEQRMKSLAEQLKREEGCQAAREVKAELQASSTTLQTSISQLKSDISTSFLRLTSVESRLADLEEQQYSARDSDPLNKSIDQKSSISLDRPPSLPEDLKDDFEPETIGKKVTNTSKMKGGIRALQQLKLSDSSEEFRGKADPLQKNLMAEQTTSALADEFIETELNFCIGLLSGGDLLLSSLESFRDMGKAGNSPLLSWDPDDEQDDGTNLSDRRVDLRSMRRVG